MTRPWSPAELEQRAFELRRELDDVVLGLPGLADTAAQAKRHYRARKAVAYLELRAAKPSWTVDEKKAHVDDVCGDAELADTIADELLRAARDRIRVGLNELDFLRTCIVGHRGTG